MKCNYSFREIQISMSKLHITDMKAFYKTTDIQYDILFRTCVFNGNI